MYIFKKINIDKGNLSFRFMWVERKNIFRLADSKIVTRDFIIAEGSGSGLYDFLDKNKNPFGRSLHVPIMYIFKVHRNHPMRIFSAGTNHIDVYPSNERKKKRPRMPGEVYKDKMDYDLFTLMLVPFENPDIGDYWKEFKIKEGFIPEENEHIKDASLVYLEHGTDIHCQDSLRISEIIPSQVIDHVFYWLRDNKKISSHDKTFKQKLEGRISIPIEQTRKLTWKVANILEERYKTRLMFDDYRESWQRKEREF